MGLAAHVSEHFEFSMESCWARGRQGGWWRPWLLEARKGSAFRHHENSSSQTIPGLGSRHRQSTGCSGHAGGRSIASWN